MRAPAPLRAMADRRAFRRRVAAQFGRPGQPSERLYGRGLLVQHYALDRLSPRALCGGAVTLVSDRPFTTGPRLMCPMCSGVVARILLRTAAQDAQTRRMT